MSTIKVNTIQTVNGTGNITLSNNVASLTSAGNITSAGDIIMSTSQKGIDFSNFTTSDSAGMHQGTPTVTGQVLMDYEQGTWPGIFRGKNGSAGSWAGGTSTGDYTKIGRMVYIAITFQLTDRGSWTGEPEVRGLPFKASSNHNFVVTFGHNNFASVGQYRATVTAGQSFIYVSFNDSSIQDYQTAVPAVSGSSDIYSFYGWYMTND